MEGALKPDAACMILAALAALWILRCCFRAFRQGREGKRRAFQQKLETVLLPRETVKVICPQKKGQWILTSRRLLLETREGFTAIPLSRIKKLQGTNAAGNRTTAVRNMVSLTVKADSDFTIENTGEAFGTLYSQLSKKVKKKKVDA